MSAEAAHDHHEEHVHEASHYIRIWGILLVLLVISIVGPMAEIPILTLITAFGIAVIKAGMVAKYFMHVDVEKPFVWYFLITALVFMLLFFAGTSPDVMKHEGTNWVNTSAAAAIERGLAEGDGHGGHGDGHGAAHDDGHGDDHGKKKGHGKKDDHGKKKGKGKKKGGDHH